MATPPFDIDETLPGDSNIVSQHPAGARTFRDVVESWLLIDHDTSGEHDKVTLPERTSDPSSAVNKGFVYSMAVGGVTELFYEDSAGTVKQLTSAGSLLIGDGDVGTDQLAALAVTGAKIAANTITGNKIALGSDAQGDIMYYNGTDWVRLPASATVDWFLQSKGAGQNPVWATSITVGTALTQNPYAVSSTVTQAHGITEPDYLKIVLECLTAEGNWSIGDRLDISANTFVGTGTMGFVVWKDATNVQLITHGTTPQIIDKTTRAALQITAANWKLIITPYKFG